MKENQSVKPVIDMAQGSVVFEVRNHTPLRLDMAKVHEDNVKRAAFVGMAQVRIVDAAAVPVQDSKGNLRTPAQRDELKYNRMKALIDHYESGSALWSPKAQAIGPVDKSELIREALKRLNVPEAKIADMDKAKLAFLATGKAVATMMLTIASERVVAVVDADAELDALIAE